MEYKPDILRFEDGAAVTGPDDWPRRRRQLLDILCREEYGYPPPAPTVVEGTLTQLDDKCACGHAHLEHIDLRFAAEKGDFTLPIRFFVPNDGQKHPTIVLMNFRPDSYDMYFPAEEILDNGFALAVACYTDVTSDDGDFTNGLAGLYTRPADGTGFGKITLWAFAASRIVDYLITRPEVDAANIAVAGHSRLGKTALWCAAQDTRIRFALDNDSGCGGSALEQAKHPGGETIADMNRNFPFWFCENRAKYIGGTDGMPFDQHFLLAAIAPRYLAIGCASLDDWADPYGTLLCAHAASPAWRLHGRQGLVAPTGPAAVGDVYHDGDIGYHLRDGIHFFGRFDWLRYMDFIKQKL